MRLALIQFAPDAPAPEGNAAAILMRYREAVDGGAQLAVFPELSLCGPAVGYLLQRRDYLMRTAELVREIAAASGECGIVFGAPLADPDGRVYNCLIFAAEGAVLHIHQQLLLPFDAGSRDRRFFSPGNEVTVTDFGGEKIGLLCGGDARAIPGWPESVRYRIDPAALLADQGATILINAAALPYRSGKNSERRAMGTYHSARHNLPFVFCNMVAVRPPEVFDGASYCLSRTGQETHLPHCREALTLIDTQTPDPIAATALDGPVADRRVLVHGIREAFRQSGKDTALLLDSGKDAAGALCRELATEALGPALHDGPSPADRLSTFPLHPLTHSALRLGEMAPEGFAPLGDLSCDAVRALSTGSGAELPLPFEGDADRILTRIIREGRSPEELVKSGFPQEEVTRVIMRAQKNIPFLPGQTLRLHDPGACPPPGAFS